MANGWRGSNFDRDEIVIAEPLSENVKCVSLVEMLDFKRSEFEKRLHTEGLQVFNLVSKWPLERLDNSVTIIRGVTYEKTDQVLDVTDNIILTADNVTLGGELEISKEVYLRSEVEIEEEKRLKKDDCFVCLSSGSREHVGKSALISAEVNGYAGGFMGILRVLPEKMLPKYLHLVLNSAGVRRIMRAKANGPNIKNLTNEIGEIKVPTPSVPEQKKLVAECEKIDKKIAQAKKDIETERAKIEGVINGVKGKGKVKLNSVSQYSEDRIPLDSIQGKDYISTDNMLQKCEGVIPFEGVPKIDKVISYKKGDVLISNIRPYLQKIWQADRDAGCSPDVLVVRLKSGANVLPAYLYYLLKRKAFFDFVMAGNPKGLKMPRGDKNRVMQYEIPDIPLPEQQKLVAKIKASEDKIAALKQVIEAAKAARAKLVENFLN